MCIADILKTASIHSVRQKMFAQVFNVAGTVHALSQSQR